MYQLPLNAHKTAIKRKCMSAPATELLIRQKFKRWDESPDFKLLDFGCGHGQDVMKLQENCIFAVGYDPYWAPNDHWLLGKYDVVLCTYVLNVVDEKDRKTIIKQLKGLTKPGGTVYITVRRDLKKNHTVSQRGTHQYNVKLPFEIIKETSSYCIYKI